MFGKNKNDKKDNELLSRWESRDLIKLLEKLRAENNELRSLLSKQEGKLRALEVEHDYKNLNYPYELRSKIEQVTKLEAELFILKKGAEALIDKALKEAYQKELDSIKKLSEKMIESIKAR
ncbi:MAG: hypothetical protein AB7I27_00550 [Bacteriovoracaceae bacterium]